MALRRAALFLDRDGVLNELVWDSHTASFESPLLPADVAIVDGAAAGIARANAQGLPVVIVSNQPSAAKGFIGVDELQAIHLRVLELLAAQGAQIDASYLCLHHPEGSDSDLGGICDCRKPAPGLLRQAADDLRLDLSRSWMIGDTDADAGAAKNAGLGGIVVITHPRSAHRRGADAAMADATVMTTTAAFERVLSELS